MYSPTQTANYVAIASVIVLILNHFGFAVPQDTVITIIAGIAALISVIISAWRRYKEGDITPLGRYKNPMA